MCRQMLLSGNPGIHLFFRALVEASAASLVPNSSYLFPAVPFCHDVLIRSIPSPSGFKNLACSTGVHLGHALEGTPGYPGVPSSACPKCTPVEHAKFLKPDGLGIERINTS